MGATKIEPNYVCPNLGPIDYPCGAPTKQDCIDVCDCDFDGIGEEELPCVSGPGTCTYRCFTCYVTEDPPGSFKWNWFWYLISETCNPPATQTYHDYDIPRKVLFDYNLQGLDGCFEEHWKKPDQNVVIRFANKPTRTNIRVLVDPGEFLP